MGISATLRSQRKSAEIEFVSRVTCVGAGRSKYVICKRESSISHPNQRAYTNTRQCDRGKPCKRCRGLGITDQCIYQSTDWMRQDTPAVNTGLKPLLSAPQAKSVKDSYSSNDETDSDLRVELKELRSKLSFIENAIKTHQQSSTPVSDHSPEKRYYQFANEQDALMNGNKNVKNDTVSPTKPTLPRTSISSLMNPLPSAINYNQDMLSEKEFKANKHLLNLGIDPKEEIVFGLVQNVTVLTNGETFSAYGPLRHFAIMTQDNHLRLIQDDILEFRKTFDKKPESVIAPPPSAGARMFDNDLDQSADQAHKKTEEFNTTFKNILPPIDTIWLLVERFFEYVYPFLPVICKSAFIQDLKRILCLDELKNEKRVSKVNIGQQIDYAVMGTLLLVLKFGHGTYQSNGPKVSPSLICMAHLCLRKFALFTEPSLKIFQFAILYRSYHRFQGFEGINENSPYIFNGLITQMAYGIGLSRDPSKMRPKFEDPELIRRWKFLWSITLHIDSNTFYTNGTNRLIRKDHYDTTEPEFVTSGSGFSNTELEIENFTIRMIRMKNEFDDLLCNLTSIVCRLNPPPKAGEVFARYEELETAMKTKLGPLSLILTTSKINGHLNNIQTVFYISTYSNCLNCIQTIFCHLIFYAEGKYNFVACRYLIARLITFAMRTIANYKTLMTKSDEIYGNEFNWIITPLFTKVISRSLLCILICFFRVVNSRNRFVETDPVKFGLLNTILYNLFDHRIWNLYLPYAKSISNKSFFAWELLKYHSLIQKVTDKAKITTKTSMDEKNGPYNVFNDMSISDMQTFVELTNLDLYTNTSEITTSKIDVIIDKLRAGMSFESSFADQQVTNMELSSSTVSNSEFLPSEYEDKYWNYLMSKEPYLYALEDISLE